MKADVAASSCTWDVPMRMGVPARRVSVAQAADGVQCDSSRRRFRRYDHQHWNRGA